MSSTESELPLGRLEALSDGVFAIAITLLALELYLAIAPFLAVPGRCTACCGAGDVVPRDADNACVASTQALSSPVHPGGRPGSPLDG